MNGASTDSLAPHTHPRHGGPDVAGGLPPLEQEGELDDVGEAGELDGFDDVFEGAGGEGAAGEGVVVGAAHHDDAGGGGDGVNRGERGDPAEAGEIDIEQDDVGRALCDQPECAGCVVGDLRGVAERGQRLLQYFAD